MPANCNEVVAAARSDHVWADPGRLGRDDDRLENGRGDIYRLSRFVARLLARPWVKQHFVVIRAEIQLGHSVEMACGHMIEDHTQDGETKSRIDDIPKPCGSSPIPGSPLRNHTSAHTARHQCELPNAIAGTRAPLARHSPQ
jgi:hypothetical protein